MNTITLAFQSLKVISDIGSGIIKADSSLEKAVLKQKLDGMMNALFLVKQNLRELKEICIEKDKEISELKGKLSDRNKTVRYLNARYHLSNIGEPTGVAFCATCWSMDLKLIPLTMTPSSAKVRGHYCCGCKNTIETRTSPLQVDYYIKSNKSAAENQKTTFEIATFD